MAKAKKRTVVKTKKKADKKTKSKLSLLKGGKTAKPKKAKENVFVRIRRYFRDVRGELKKVAWPNRQQVVSSTLVVLTTVLLLALIVSFFDTIFQFIVRNIL